MGVGCDDGGSSGSTTSGMALMEGRAYSESAFGAFFRISFVSNSGCVGVGKSNALDVFCFDDSVLLRANIDEEGTAPFVMGVELKDFKFFTPTTGLHVFGP